MPTSLPKDIDNQVIPALRFKSGCAHSISVSSASATNETAFSSDTKVVSIYATAPVYIEFGDSSVVADSSTSHYFPEGIYYDVAVTGSKSKKYTHIAALSVESDCSVYISEKE